MRHIELNNGIAMPVIGTGTNTYGKEGNAYQGALTGDTTEIEWAIENGYRHFDTAQSYRNEKVLGDGLQASGLPREEFFIVTKLRRLEDDSDLESWVQREVEASLERLQTTYLDQFLIHHPWDNDSEMVHVWKILEAYYASGTFRSIGVSNFDQRQLELIMDAGTVPPAANQIESHPGLWNDDLIRFHETQGIATVAWSPLRGISNHEALGEIGQRYGKTAAQIALRYQIERDVIVIPKSHNKDRQAQSLDIFDFQLTPEERELIKSL